MEYSILVLNTGSTSTKLAVYRNETKMVQKEYQHSKDFLKKFPYVADQLPMRQEIVEKFITTEAANYAPFDAIVARGGILPPIQSGGYTIDEAMVDYLLNISNEEHASNLSACIAYDIKRKYNIPFAFIYDGITIAELESIARISGIPDMPRVSVAHALNMRATARKAAESQHKQYDEMNIITVHMGGGFSMAFHKNGKMIDVVGDDEGPFSPERSGGQQLVQMIKYLQDEPD